MTKEFATGWMSPLAVALPMVLGLHLAGPPLARATMLMGNHVVLTFGSDGKPHAQITFPKDRAAREPVIIEVFGTRGAGSGLSILVDTDNAPIFEHNFTADECKNDYGAGHCTISIDALPAAVLRDRFRRGLVSHLRIDAGGSMTIGTDAPLNGFAKARVKGRRLGRVGGNRAVFARVQIV